VIGIQKSAHTGGEYLAATGEDRRLFVVIVEDQTYPVQPSRPEARNLAACFGHIRFVALSRTRK
jgi:hypothetical protein